MPSAAADRARRDGGTIVRLRPAAIAGTLLLTASVLAVGVPTNAAASAPRCTITGTPGADRLVGTRGNDVICGLGGNDRIFAGPGQDVVRGGAGADRISGDRGHDWLYGELGDDHIDGGPGYDHGVGGPGRDDLRGDGGEDRLEGGAGADRLLGGPGHDWILGGDGKDVCPYEPQDNQRSSCTYDRERPQLRSIAATPTVVDVTSASRAVTFRARFSDDAGISEGNGEGWAPYVGVGSYTYFLGYADFERVSGTAQDGTWEARINVPRGMPATRLHAMVVIRDVAGRVVTIDEATHVEVVDDDPDTLHPEVQLRSPAAGATYDVRNEAKSITVRARVTDDKSGVATVSACVIRPNEHGTWNYEWEECGRARRISGTSKDGVWQTSIRLVEDARGGPACIRVRATDRAHPGYDYNNWTCAQAAEAHEHAFGGDLGEILIRGSTN